MISKFSIKRPYTVIVAIVLVCILGFISFRNTGIDLLPNINLPYIVVATVYPGGESPEMVEENVTLPLERAITGADGIKNVSSESYPMVSLIIIELNNGVDIDGVLLGINQQISNFKTINFGQNALSSGDITGVLSNILDPVIMTVNPSMLPIMKLSLYEDGKTAAEYSERLRAVAKEIESLDGVSSVDVTGLFEEMYFLNVDNGKLLKAAMTSFISEDKLFDAFYDGLLKLLETLETGGLSQNAAEIIKILSDAADSATAGLSALLDRALDLFAPYLDAAADYAGQSAEAVIRQAFSNGYSLVPDYLKPAWQLLEDAAVDAGLAAVGAIRDLPALAGAALKEAANVVRDGFVAALEALYGNWLVDNLSAADDEIKLQAGIARMYLEDPVVKYELRTLFLDGLDKIFDYAGSYMGEIISADLLKTAFTANNIEMPAGSLNGSIITVGNRPVTEEELFTLPIARVNIPDFILSNVANGFTLGDLSGIQSGAASALNLLNGILTFAAEPGTALSGALDGVLSILETGSGIEKDTLLFLLGIDGAAMAEFFTGLDFLAASTGIGALSLDGLIALNDAFGGVIQELEGFDLDLRLNDICDIIKLNNGSSLYTLLNGSSGVQFNINKSPSASTNKVSKAVIAKLNQLTKADSKLHYVVLEDQGDYIGLVIDTILGNLIIGGMLAILVLLFFLKKLGSTVVIGASIILSLVITFILMYAFGINLNIASMAGLMLGVGMLVDNSIVVIENIFSIKNSGKGIFEAAIEGSKQVSGAIAGATLTTIVVFVPLFFAEGFAADIFGDLALTMSFSIISSLVVALTFVPMAATTFLKNADKQSKFQLWAQNKFESFAARLKKRPKLIRVLASPVVFTGNMIIRDSGEKDGKFFNGFKRFYKKLLGFCLNKKLVPIITVGVLFVTAILTAFFIGSEILPELDMNTIDLTFTADRDALYKNGIDKDDLLRETAYIIDRETGKYRGNEITDIGISASSGFKIMGSSMSDISGGLVDTKGMLEGTILSGATKSGDLDCSILLSDKKNRKLSAKDFASDISDAILASVYVDRGEFGRGVSYKLSEFFSVSASFNSIAEIATLESDSVQLNIYGNDSASIRSEVESLTAYLRSKGLKGVAAVENTVENAPLQYKIVVDKVKASKYGQYTGTVLLALMSRFSNYSPSASVKLVGETGAFYTYDVTFYPNQTKVLKWYRAADPTNTYDNIYVEDALSDDGSVIQRYYTYDFIGMLWHLERKTDARGIEYFIREGQEGSAAAIYLEKQSDVLYYSVEYRNPIEDAKDLLYYKLPYENQITGAAGTVELWKLLTDDCIIWKDGVPADIVRIPGESKIGKTNGLRYLPITVYAAEGSSVSAVKRAVGKAVGEYYKGNAAGLGITYGFSSSTTLMDEIFNTLYFVLGLGIVFVYLIMVMQFRSLKEPLIIMAAIPLAFTGSILALLLFGMKLSVISVIAFTVLAGVVVNNGIVFMDYANKLLQDGFDVRYAVMKAAADRLRPILMTAMTTIVSLGVMAFDGSRAASMLRPMGVAALGGMIYSTFLTLIVIPVLFEMFNRKGKKKKGLFAEGREYFAKLEKAEKERT